MKISHNINSLVTIEFSVDIVVNLSYANTVTGR